MLDWYTKIKYLAFIKFYETAIIRLVKARSLPRIYTYSLG